MEIEPTNRKTTYINLCCFLVNRLHTILEYFNNDNNKVETIY